MRAIRLFAIIALLVAESAFAARAEFKGGSANIRLQLGPADVVQVAVETTRPSKSYIYSKAYGWGGDKTTAPETIIKRLAISRNGQKLYIPLSVYADLGAPSELWVEELPCGGIQVTLRGGDAGASYWATLTFNKSEITRRKVVSGEFFEYDSEETSYTFNHFDN